MAQQQNEGVFVGLSGKLVDTVNVADLYFPIERVFVPAGAAIHVDDIRTEQLPNTEGEIVDTKVADFTVIKDGRELTCKVGTLGHALGVFKKETVDMADTFERKFGTHEGPSQLAQQLMAAGFTPTTENSELDVPRTMGRADQHESLDDLMKIEPNVSFEAIQPILNLKTGATRVAVGDEFKVIDLIPSDDGDKKHTRVVIEIGSKQHNVSYGAVFRAIREPRPGDKTYETISVKQEEPKASQALAPRMVFELHGILLATTGNSISFKRGSKATILNVIDSKSVAVKITEPFAKSRIFAVKTVSLLTSGKLVKSAKKAIAA